MAVNFRELINKQLNQLDGGNSNGGGNEDTRKKERVDIGRKHPFFGRVLPLGTEEFPFTNYAEAWVDYTTKDGKQTMTKLVLDVDDRDDKLTSLLYKAIRYNNEYRKEHQNFKGDKIIMNHKQADSPYPFRISRRAEFVGIPLAKDLNGQLQLKTNTETGYEFVNYSVSNAAYKTLLELTQSDTLMVNGKPFDTDLGYITKDETLPVAIKLNTEGRGYDVQPSMMVLPAITFDYLQRGTDGDYLYFDDPALHNKPTKETNPGLYEAVLQQLTNSVNAQMGADKESQVNPYVEAPQPQVQTPVAPAPQTVQAPVQPAPSVTPQNAPQAPVAPQPANPTPVAPKPAQQAPVAPKPQVQAPAPGVSPAPQPITPKPASAPMQSLEDVVGSDDIFGGDDIEVNVDEDSLPF